MRIYGPQVEHLIDRDAELMILRRLARQKIGPRLLGTFTNGRFEEFLHAKTLTPADLRQPQTFCQIAKRMRELHDGVELLEHERDGGATVWRNWDTWVDRCERIVTYIDDIAQGTPGRPLTRAQRRLQSRGLVCGTQWRAFRAAVDAYRVWLDHQLGGPDAERASLVFAHNDTQYGNILRLEPPGTSPLLLPANVHKQLVVIDFEYANANPPGLEFANHFTEWCYNYHDEHTAHVCTTSRYPSPEDQTRFLRSYVAHQPAYAPAASTPRLAASTPSFGPQQAAAARRPPMPARGSSSSSVLHGPSDERSVPLQRTDTAGSVDSSGNPTAVTLSVGDAAEVSRLSRETRLWRAANSAKWVAWGIVQANVPGLPAEDGQSGPTAAEDDDAEEEEEFDYLGYAHERALFFWGDAVQAGIVDAAMLPEEVRAKLKLVPY